MADTFEMGNTKPEIKVDDPIANQMKKQMEKDAESGTLNQTIKDTHENAKTSDNKRKEEEKNKKNDLKKDLTSPFVRSPDSSENLTSEEVAETFIKPKEDESSETKTEVSSQESTPEGASHRTIEENVDLQERINSAKAEINAIEQKGWPGSYIKKMNNVLEKYNLPKYKITDVGPNDKSDKEAILRILDEQKPYNDKDFETNKKDLFMKRAEEKKAKKQAESDAALEEQRRKERIRQEQQKKDIFDEEEVDATKYYLENGEAIGETRWPDKTIYSKMPDKALRNLFESKKKNGLSDPDLEKEVSRRFNPDDKDVNKEFNEKEDAKKAAEEAEKAEKEAKIKAENERIANRTIKDMPDEALRNLYENMSKSGNVPKEIADEVDLRFNPESKDVNEEFYAKEKAREEEEAARKAEEEAWAKTIGQDPKKDMSNLLKAKKNIDRIKEELKTTPSMEAKMRSEAELESYKQQLSALADHYNISMDDIMKYGEEGKMVSDAVERNRTGGLIGNWKRDSKAAKDEVKDIKSKIKEAKRNGESTSELEKDLTKAEAKVDKVREQNMYFLLDAIATGLGNISIPGAYGRESGHKTSAYEDTIKSNLAADLNRYNKAQDATVQEMIDGMANRNDVDQGMVNAANDLLKNKAAVIQADRLGMLEDMDKFIAAIRIKDRLGVEDWEDFFMIATIAGIDPMSMAMAGSADKIGDLFRGK